jgi:hypothetical protein
MASRQEIAITIKGNLSASSGGGKEEISYSRGSAPAISSDDNATKEMSKYSNAGSQKNSSVTKSVIAVYMANQIKNRIVQTASTMWNRYVDMKEDYIAQNNMNQIKAHVGAVSSYATAAISGAKIGGVLGPAGAAIGAAVGTIGNAVNRAVSYKTTIANYNEQNNAMNAQTNFSRVRMGLIDGGRGTDN